MKRLVYSPTVKAWVKTDTGVVDLSPFITDCHVERKIDDISKLAISFRNPKVMQGGKMRFLFTESIRPDGELGPLLHPMDPITVVLERIAGYPVQAFTGYCDTTPYIQLFPGVARLTASCTLKRLEYTFWDQALPFVSDFMKKYGWELGTDGTARKGSGGETGTDVKNNKTAAGVSVGKAVNDTLLNDGSIGNLLYAVLNEVGGWDDKDIFVQPLPENIASIVSHLYDETVAENKSINQELTYALSKIIGSGVYGTAGGPGGQPNTGLGHGSGTTPIAPADAPAVLQQLINVCDAIARHRTYYSQANRDGAGGVGTPNPSPGGAYYFDCSSFVSYALNQIGHYGGNMSWAEVSGWYESWGDPGSGRFLTVWSNADHVFLEIKDKNGGSKFIGTSHYIQDQNPDPHSPVGHSHTVGWLNSYPTAGFVPRHIRGF